MEAWYVAGAADGFNLMFPLLPDDWLNFAQLVVPELQRRGLTRKEYATGTLRDRLGLPKPPNRFTSNSSAPCDSDHREQGSCDHNEGMHDWNLQRDSELEDVRLAADSITARLPRKREQEKR